MKSVVIINVICAVLWVFCSIGNFSVGNTGLAVFQLLLAVLWGIIAIINYKNYKSKK